MERIVKPDKVKHDNAIEIIQKQISKLQNRMVQIRSEADAIQAGRGGVNEKMANAKSVFSSIKSEKDVLIQERNVLSAQLKEQTANRDVQSKSQKQLRSEVKYTSESEIDAAMDKLRYQQETQSMSLMEEKKLIKELEALQQSKKLTAKLMSEMSNMDKCKGSIKEIRALHDAKNSQIDKVQARLMEQKKVMDDIYNENPADRDAFPKLMDERKALKLELDEKYGKIRELRTEFKEANDVYFNFVRKQREERKEQQKLEDEKRQAEYLVKLAEYEKEMEKIHPYQDEMDLCNALEKYLKATYPKELKKDDKSSSDDKKSCCGEKVELEGMQPLKREEESFYVIAKGKSGGKKNKKSKDKKISLPISQLESFTNIGVTPPSTVNGVSKAFDEVLARKAFFDKQTKRDTADVKKTEGKGNKTPKSKNYNGVDDFPSLGTEETKQGEGDSASWGPKPTN